MPIPEVAHRFGEAHGVSPQVLNAQCVPEFYAGNFYSFLVLACVLLSLNFFDLDADEVTLPHRRRNLVKLERHNKNAESEKRALQHSVELERGHDVVKVGLARHDVEERGFRVQTLLQNLRVLDAEPDVGRRRPQTKKFEPAEPVVTL